MLRRLLFLSVFGLLEVSAGADPLWVAVGLKGRVLVSPNGNYWKEIRLALHAPLRAVACDGRRFVAVGGTPQESLTLLTPDGDGWTELPTVPGGITTVCAGQGRFVAMHGGRLRLLEKEHEFEEADPLPLAGEVRALASACGDTEAGYAYAFLGEIRTADGTLPWRGVTQDGRHWIYASQEAPPARALVHGAGIFVAAGAHSLLETSIDGITWTHRELSEPDDLETLLWTGQQFVAQGKHLHTSPDGLTWHTEPEPPPGPLLWGGRTKPFLALSWSQVFLKGDLKTWKPLHVTDATSDAGAIVAVAAREE